ncbi:MAG: DUF4268 domain-containing protein [bacterium]
MGEEVVLGRLEPLDLRAVWLSEPGHFTPWLAKEENLVLLANTIGLDLELEAQEKNVGPFRADILCKDTVTGNWVLIENQLERTDHLHLGQLLTYAAGLKAVTIVWIAYRFTEEHRAALDWLNEITDDRFSFFGLEVELWRIGNSPPAPKFNAVCKPNDWSKKVAGGASQIESAELSETKKLQLEYWTEFSRVLIDRKSPVRPQKPLPQHWATFAVGRSNFYLMTFVNTRDCRIGVILVLAGQMAKAHFNLLAQDRVTIDKEIGVSAEWRELPEKKESHVELRLDKTDPTKHEEWPTQHAWLAERLELFHRVFAPRVKKLDAANYRPEEDGSEV